MSSCTRRPLLPALRLVRLPSPLASETALASEMAGLLDWVAMVACAEPVTAGPDGLELVTAAPEEPREAA